MRTPIPGKAPLSTALTLIDATDPEPLAPLPKLRTDRPSSLKAKRLGVPALPQNQEGKP
jgi:hypothetical protein